MRRTVAALSFVVALGCKHAEPTSSPLTTGPTLAAVVIEPAPEHLRGRVALPNGARLYARPNYASPSWQLSLPDPPAIAADAPARVRAFRVVGIVRSPDGVPGSEFIAVTNDLDGEAESVHGCGPRFHDLDHLRTLLYVPIVYLAEVTTRSLELQPWSWAGEREQLHVGAGVRVGPAAPVHGLPAPPEHTSWRWLDADGIRVLAPIPDDAIGRAWDPADTPTIRKTGEELLQDADGSLLWLGDDGGATVVLGVRNACGEHQRIVDDPGEVESLRALAMELFYDQSPPREQAFVAAPDADYLIVAGTALRWPDGELAGEVLQDWGVSVGVGQSWGDRRCFPLVLSGELRPFEQPALACVAPEALEPLAGALGFGATDELALGGSIELGPPELLAGAWTESLLQPVLNSHHASVAECLRPMLDGEQALVGARWVLMMIADANGRVDSVELTALGDTRDAVEDCLRVEAYTWLLPEGGGQVLVPITLGNWLGNGDASTPEPTPTAEPKDKGKGKDKSEAKPDRGQVIIIRDEDEPAEDTSE